MNEHEHNRLIMLVFAHSSAPVHSPSVHWFFFFTLQPMHGLKADPADKRLLLLLTPTLVRQPSRLLVLHCTGLHQSLRRPPPRRQPAPCPAPTEADTVVHPFTTLQKLPYSISKYVVSETRERFIYLFFNPRATGKTMPFQFQVVCPQNLG